MRSTSYKGLVNMIRNRKELIEHDLESRHFDNPFIAATDVMCTTWYIKGQLEKMQTTLDDIYWDVDMTKLSRREYQALDNYIDRLSDYYWNLLYDEASKINGIIYVIKEI